MTANVQKAANDRHLVLYDNFYLDKYKMLHTYFCLLLACELIGAMLLKDCQKLAAILVAILLFNSLLRPI